MVRLTTNYLLTLRAVAGCAAGSARPKRHPSGGGVLSLYPSSLQQEAYAGARLPRNAVAWLMVQSDTKIVRLDDTCSTRPFLWPLFTGVRGREILRSS